MKMHNAKTQDASGLGMSCAQGLDALRMEGGGGGQQWRRKEKEQQNYEIRVTQKYNIIRKKKQNQTGIKENRKQQNFHKTDGNITTIAKHGRWGRTTHTTHN